MKADSLKISNVFQSGGDILYILPYFQREYSWEKNNWKTLFEDVQSVYEAYSPDREPEHFMGSLVVITDGTRNGVIPAFKLVDGQQRLTTISLLLFALNRLVLDSHPEVARRIQKLVTNPDEKDDLYFKLLPTNKYGDRSAYKCLLRGEAPSLPTESRIPEAYNYLYQELEDRLVRGEIDPNQYFVCVTNCLQVVFISLDQRERPYEIFESLNAKAKPLSPADLVRNYIAMKLPEKRQEETFNKYWVPIDDQLQEKRTVGKSRLGELTAFLRHYLAMLSGLLPNEQHVYERLRDRMEKDFAGTDAFVDELAVLKRYAAYYDWLLRPFKESNLAVRAQLERLNVLEVSTAYPLLLAMYEARFQGRLDDAAFLEGLKIIENYLVRRYLAGEPTNYQNKMFPALWAALDVNHFVDSLKQALLSRNYPSDAKLKNGIYTEGVYKGSQAREKTTLILESINRNLSKGSGALTILDGDSTIEHILPQTPSDAWKKHLGENWDQIYREYLNTLGNLTLVTQEWNSTLSNEVFNKKRAILAAHGLRLNSDYFAKSSSQWNEAAIKNRADYLGAQVLEIWPAFGQPPATTSGKGTIPKSLMILGERKRVESWRDVAEITAEVVIQFSNDFENILKQLPNYFFKEETRYTHRRLSNGWWLYTNLSGSATKSLCRRLIAVAGIPDDEWSVEEV